MPSLAQLAAEKTAEIYDLAEGVSADNRIGTIDVSKLAPLFAAATWRSGGRWTHMGEFHLVFENGMHIRWRLPGTYFLVDGWPGHFVFPDDSRESLNILRHLMEKTMAHRF